jgi:hypothetical protein
MQSRLTDPYCPKKVLVTQGGYMKVLIIGLTTLFSLNLFAKTNHFGDYKGTFVLLDGKSKKIESKC